MHGRPVRDRPNLERRCLILGAGAAILAHVPPLKAQEAWTIYRNARFGTTIAYQEVFEPDAPPANGDGQAFTGPEGARFTVSAHYNTADETPRSILADLLGDARYGDIRYQAIQARRLTISGMRGDRIYYESFLVSPRDIVHAFTIEYRAKWKAAYDNTVRRMAASFSGG